MTLPTGSSWAPVKEPLRVPYEAPQGRRVNVIGAVFTHGPLTGECAFASYVSIPKVQMQAKTKTPQQIAAGHDVQAERLGPIDSTRFVEFVWRVAGRPQAGRPHLSLVDLVDGAPWQRERPLYIVLDNYSVHKSQEVQAAVPQWQAANVFLVYLPAYSPQLSRIEGLWHAVKGHGMPYRSQTSLGAMQRAVMEALAAKAKQLRHAQIERLLCAETKNFECLAA